MNPLEVVSKLSNTSITETCVGGKSNKTYFPVDSKIISVNRIDD